MDIATNMEAYLIAAGFIGAVFLVMCTVAAFHEGSVDEGAKQDASCDNAGVDVYHVIHGRDAFAAVLRILHF